MEPHDGQAEPDEREDIIGALFRSGRVNAAVSWFFVGVLALSAIESVVVADRLWALFTAVVGGIVLLPPIAHRDFRVMLPWEVLALSLAPILVGSLLGGELGTFAYYLSVAGLALVVTVELHTFTTIRMTDWFAVVFVAMATLAAGAAWAVVRWNADRLLGTEFLADPAASGVETNAALMSEFLWVTAAGLVAGILFDAYFKRRGSRLRRRIREVIR